MPLNRRVLWAGLGLIAIPSAYLLLESLALIALRPNVPYDWWLLEEAYRRTGTGTMYQWDSPQYVDGSRDYLYRYSPLLPYVMAPFIAGGLLVWRIAHLVALPALPRYLALPIAVSGPFWLDVAQGNFMIFGLVAAWWALDGRRWAVAAFFVWALLIPRPLVVPIAVTILRRQPDAVRVAAVTSVVVIVLTLMTGEAGNWLEALRGSSIDLVGTSHDWGPSRLVGVAWWPVGIVLGAWLTIRGRPGLAALSVSPYILPYYLLVAGLELQTKRR